MNAPDTNSLYPKEILLMFVQDSFYPIESSGIKPIREEAADHGRLNDHVHRIENEKGEVLWARLTVR